MNLLANGYQEEKSHRSLFLLHLLIQHSYLSSCKSPNIHINYKLRTTSRMGGIFAKDTHPEKRKKESISPELVESPSVRKLNYPRTPWLFAANAFGPLYPFANGNQFSTWTRFANFPLAANHPDHRIRILVIFCVIYVLSGDTHNGPRERDRERGVHVVM